MHRPTRLWLTAGLSATFILAFAPSSARAAASVPTAPAAGLLLLLLAGLVVVQGWMAQQGGSVLPWSGALGLLVGTLVLLWCARRQAFGGALATLAKWRGWAGHRIATHQRRTGEHEAGLTDIDPCERGPLLTEAKQHFLGLQRAWDAADLAALAALTTPAMLQELRDHLPERGTGPNRTDVLSLEARLLCYERWGPTCVATIEFSGMVREAPERGAEPFRELWMLTRSNASPHAADWRLARHQALL